MSHKFVVIDEIMAQLESAKSGLIPSSVKQSIVSGIQNVPTAIKQPTVNGASGAAYTTFPLSPIIDNCCIDKTYLNLEFDVSFHVKATGIAKNDEIPFFIGFRDTASLFNQIQFLIEGSVIWQTVYQREESVLAYNSLPETEIRGNNQYASIDKMRNNTYCPMKRVVVKFSEDTEVANGKNVTIHFKVTVDINRLSPIFSNIHFTTQHMGNLRLKVYLQEFAKCMFFCPDYGYSADRSTTDASGKPIVTILDPNMVQYWQFYSFNQYFASEIDYSKIPFFAIDNGSDSDNTKNPIKKVSKITFNNPTGGLDFMTFANGLAEIVQTNFAIKEEEYKRLNDYFAGLGSVIIPTNVWSTNVFNNSIITGHSIPGSMIGNVSGYNIDSISVWFHPTQSPCSFCKEFLKGTQLLLEGRPINPIPYDNYGDKFVTDMTQALVDTDCEEINKDYMSSITVFNFDGQHFYDDKDYAAPSTRYGTGNKSINCSYLANPNSFCFNFSTNLPDAFHSGACILENTNKQSIIRFISSDAQNITSATFPVITNSKTSDSITAGFSCLCDACIVLSYDAARGTCFGGQLSWAAPYM